MQKKKIRTFSAIHAALLKSYIFQKIIRHYFLKQNTSIIGQKK